MTGKKETELPEARRGFAKANYVDSFPWIWRDYENAGYVTQWAEDMQSIGTFQLRMLGFRKQPVDHYMRVFYLEAERYYQRFRRLCLGSISRHRNMLNWVREFFTLYDGKPKFSFIFHSEASHNYNNPLSLLDDDLKEFLVYLKESGIMDNTILLLMSDHGMRISDLRQYSQGKLEEVEFNCLGCFLIIFFIIFINFFKRLPFFSIRMPESFQRANPEAMRNLRLNSRKLTTPFDIHETLEHFLNFDNSSLNPDWKSPNQRMPRGISLLKHIPANRACEDAQIEAHWCSCLNWIDLNITETESTPKSLKNFDIQFDSFELDSIKPVNMPQNESVSANLSQSVYSRRQNVDLTELGRIRTNLRRISSRVVDIAKRAVSFINSLIDSDVSSFCYPLRLHSIQKLSKLDLNRRLLAFKMSKDIHGREALFDFQNTTKNRNSSNQIDEEFRIVNESSDDIVKSFGNQTNGTMAIMGKKKKISGEAATYQIIFTTWPGNGTYELSFRFSQVNGEFMFNRNEISRINSYNSTSNCMVNKRPDLRQYCFCKYV